MTSFNPLDPAFYRHPHPTYAALRRNDPVACNTDAGMWTVARHADVMAVSRDPETFCSGRGVLPVDRGREVAVVDSILFMDPPEHVRHRKLVSAAFTPKRVADFEPVVRSIAARLLDELAPGDEIEFVDAVAAPLPMLVIAEMLGVSPGDREKFRTWSDAMVAAATEYTDDSLVKAAELYSYFADVLDHRRRTPRDDLISVLAHATVDGELLSTGELLGFCMTLLVAGNETTRNLIAGGVHAFIEHPQQWERLLAETALIPSAVEELLRWVTPVMSFARTATRATEIGGVPVREGDFVLMLYASANRDESAFGTTAAALDIARSPNPHLAFGFGEHFCLGAALARLEARVFLEELLARFSRLRSAGDPQRLPSVLMNGLVSLPVVVEP